VKVSVRDALDVLAPRQRVAIVLRYLGDLQVAEVAKAMGCSEGTAKATLHTALAKLRTHLGPMERPNGAANDAGAVRGLLHPIGASRSPDSR
jgi:DNA-directed RNA polymerase specialized sigma24 family protein